jgi:hypothetical protein
MAAIDRNSQVVSVKARISLETWTNVLESASSPALIDAAPAYRAILAAGVDPAFCLAIFAQESAFGSAGLAVANKSPGNTRSSITGKGMVVETTKGKFVRYGTWLEGFRDLAARFVAPDYIYSRNRLTTIGQIIPVFAPVSDGNDPARYIESVCRLMNAWTAAAGEEGTTSSMEIIDLTANTPSRVYTTRLLPIKEAVLHETSGPNDKNGDSIDDVKAANAATIRWFQGAATTGVSIHYYIGPEKMGAPIYRLCEERFTAYHAIGNKGFYVNASKDNHQSIGIERFGFPTEPVGPNQRAALLWLVANIAARHGLAPEQIISHASIQSDRTDGRILLDACREVVRNGGINNVSTESTNKPFNPNPKGFSVGQGVIDKATAERLEVLTNEQYMVPESGQAAGLSKRSMTWASKNGAIYLIIGIQDLDGNNQPLPTWTMQAWLQAA